MENKAQGIRQDSSCWENHKPQTRKFGQWWRKERFGNSSTRSEKDPYCGSVASRFDHIKIMSQSCQNKTALEMGTSVCGTMAEKSISKGFAQHDRRSYNLCHKDIICQTKSLASLRWVLIMVSKPR